MRTKFAPVVRGLPRQNPAVRVTLSRGDVDGIVSDLQGLTLFEAERALARTIVEDNALTGADRERLRALKKGLVEGGGLLEFIPTPEGLDHIGGLEKL